MITLKKFIQVIVSFFLISGVMFVISPSVGYACKCVGGITVQEQIERSGAILSGRVKEIRESSNRYGKEVLFEVTNTWKGIDKLQVIISTGNGDGDCGYGFAVGVEYLVYASTSDIYGG